MTPRAVEARDTVNRVCFQDHLATDKWVPYLVLTCVKQAGSKQRAFLEPQIFGGGKKRL